MDPFRVECQSCRGKLVIRSADFLGQIVACPRCKGLVQVPSSPVNNSSDPSKPNQVGAIDVKQAIVPAGLDSGAITRVDDGKLAEIAAQVEMGPLASNLPPSIPEHIEWRREPIHESTPALADSVNAPGATTHQVTETASNPPKPAGNLQKQWGKVVAAGIGTSVFAIVCFLLFLNYVRSSATTVQVQPAQKPGNEVLAIENPLEREADEQIKNKEEGDSSAELLENPTEVVDKPKNEASQDSEMPEIAIENPTKDNNPAEVSKKEDDSIKKPLAGFNLDSKEKTNSESPKENDKAQVADDEIPPFIKKLGATFDRGSMTLQSDAATSENPDAIFENNAKVDVATLYHPDAIRAPLWEDVQNLNIAKLVAKEKRLSSILIYLGQSGGIGIGWDYDAVRFSEFDVNQIVSLEIEQKSIGQSLHELIHPLGLTALVQESGQIVLQPSLELVNAKLPKEWDLSDFIKNEADIDKWNDILAAFFPWLKNAIELKGTVLQWTGDVTSTDKAFVAVFLDQMRVSSGGRPKSSFEDEFINPVQSLKLSSELLSKTGSRINKESISMVSLLDTAADDVGLDLMIDWQMCNSHGMTHAASGVSLTRNRTWPQVAGKYLDQFALVAVVDGPSRIVLTTLPGQRRMWRTMVIALEPNDSVDKIRESLRTLSPTDAIGRSVLLVKELPLSNAAGKKLAAIRIAPPNVLQMRQSLVQDFIEKQIGRNEK